MSNRLISRRAIVGALAAAPLFAAQAFAHHGWAWTSPEPFVLSGTIETLYIGNPHAVMTVRAEDGVWEVDLAPLVPTTNAGFVEGVAEPGDEVSAYGYRSADESQLWMKAARIVVNGETYDVYPRRAQAFE
jgi:hypothetical protein